MFIRIIFRTYRLKDFKTNDVFWGFFFYNSSANPDHGLLHIVKKQLPRTIIAEHNLNIGHADDTILMADKNKKLVKRQCTKV